MNLDVESEWVLFSTKPPIKLINETSTRDEFANKNVLYA